MIIFLLCFIITKGVSHILCSLHETSIFLITQETKLTLVRKELKKTIMKDTAFGV